MSGGHPQRGREVHSGVLRGHFRTGRTYRTAMTAMPGMTPSDWVAQDLPDLLWPLILVARAGESGAYVIGQAQDAAIKAVNPDDPRACGGLLDGRLTSIEAFDGDRNAVASALYELPAASVLFEPGALGILALYGEALPGRWLFENAPGAADALSVDDAVRVLADAIVAVVGDRHLNALVKSSSLRWQMITGLLSIPAGLGDELIDYPTVKENIGKADAFILSSFLSWKVMIPDEVRSARDAWAASFWNANWSMAPCLPDEYAADEQDEEDTPAVGDAMPPAAAAAADLPEADDEEANRDHPGWPAMEKAIELYEAFLDDVMSPDAPVDLSRPARFEVLTGLVARAMRQVIAILRAPHQWSGEQAAPVMRALIEARIVATWLLAQGDDSWFERYQDYGLGKRKLHGEVLRDLAERMGDDAPPALVAQLEQLQGRGGGEYQAMFQDVSVDSTFAGKNLRVMADEVGMADDYRLRFQVESGVTHGEWWAIEEYAMQRCMNPLHRFHLLPTFSPMYSATAGFPRVALARFEDLIELAATGIRGGRAQTGS